MRRRRCPLLVLSTCIVSCFYLTESAALDRVAPIPGAECFTGFLVSANSPSLCPSISSVICTRLNSFPW